MLLGLHWLDALILLAYIITVLWLGKHLAAKVKNEGDFFLAGRKLGKWFQFFLNFGNMTDPSAAATTSSSVYRQGAGGVWLSLIPLFLTPGYWFMNVWFRRVRLTTIGDLFTDRFGRSFLASLYAFMNLGIAILSIGLGNLIAYKTLAPIMAKPPAAYTVAEQAQVRDYREFADLADRRSHGILSEADQQRFALLKGYHDRGALQPFVSYLKPLPFYAVSAVVVAIFVIQGGLEASAIVDAIQSLLIVVISVILLPFGLHRIGGFHGLHAKLGREMFELFGGAGGGEYRWYSIAAFLFVQFVGISAAQANMAISGSAKNELAARMGGVTGGFTKRFVTLAWCLCGLVAVALFGPSLADPDQTWGLLTTSLLPIGLVGTMIVGILGGKIASLGASSLVMSALVVKNLYEPLFPGKTERHYMIVARAVIPVFLLMGIAVALFLGSAVALLKLIITLMVVWGAPILVMFTWRRVTLTAVKVQVVSCLLFIGVIPWMVTANSSLRRSHAFLTLTAGTPATMAGATVMTPGVDPVSVYFDGGIVPIDPANPSAGREGQGYFNVEAYVLHCLGVPVERFSPADLLAARYAFDGIFPLILLFAISSLTQPSDQSRVDRFYARLKTPVQPTLEEDAEAVRISYANPQMYDDTKLFEDSWWEFTVWNRQDLIGFVTCCVIVGLILVIFEVALQFGA